MRQIVIALFILATLQVDFVPFNARRNGQAQSPRLTVTQPAAIQSSTTSPSDLSTSQNVSVSSPEPTMEELEARIAELEVENAKLKGSEACVQATWSVADMSMKASVSTMNLENCMSDLDKFKTKGSSAYSNLRSHTQYKSNLLQEDFEARNQRLKKCNEDLLSEKEEFTMLMDKFNSINVQDINNLMKDNDRASRSLARYAAFQSKLQSQQSSMNRDRRNKDNIMRNIRNDINRSLRQREEANNSIEVCSDNDKTYRSCLSSVNVAKSKISVTKNRLRSIEAVNESLRNAIKQLNNRVSQMSAPAAIIRSNW